MAQAIAEQTAATELTPEQAEKLLEELEREVRRRRYMRDPLAWVENVLKEELWSGQKRILQALRDHRKVAVASCHEIGKSFISSRAVAWWIDVHKAGEAFVVTSAPSGPQVRTILWREIARAHTRGNLRGRINTTEWHLEVPGGKEEQVAIGRKPNDYDPTAFQGIHARYCMYVFDEACGMPPALWEAADSLIANENSKALAFGNPDDSLSEFARICQPGSGWHVIHIGAFETPNFTGEELSQPIREQLISKIYVEEKRRRWAPNWFWVNEYGEPCDMTEGVRVVPPAGEDPSKTGAFWQSKVLGLFPAGDTEGTLIPLQWIRQAQERQIPRTGTKKLGMDVGAGGDESTVAENDNGVVRILWTSQEPDTMKTCGRLIGTLHETGAYTAHVDYIGIGRGVVDRAKELKKPVVGIDVGKSPYERPIKVRLGQPPLRQDDAPGFVNLRAQLWWGLRVLFQEGKIDLDPMDEDTAGELLSVRYERKSNGKIQIESKADAKSRGVPSPNRAEAVMLSTSEAPPVQKRAVWGRK
jgi:hypothetical protein